MADILKALSTIIHENRRNKCSPSGAANARSTSFFDGRGSEARGGTARCVHVLASITAPLHSAHKRLPRPRRPRERMIRPGSVSNWTRSIRRSITTGTCRPRLFGGKPPRSRNCGAVNLSVRIFMPRPFMSKARQPINDSCGSPATARSRSSATRARENYTAQSAEYRLHVNILNRPYKGD